VDVISYKNQDTTTRAINSIMTKRLEVWHMDVAIRMFIAV
jgi:hypothetical protein